MIQIKLDQSSSNFKPGSKISGKVFFQNHRSGQKLNAYLGWVTEGKGDEDKAIVVEETWMLSEEEGSRSFEWVVPRGPLSLRGKFIRIRWYVAASSTKFRENPKVEIVVSHLPRPIVLSGL